MELSQLREQAVADALEAGLRAGVESVIAYAVGLMRQAVGMGQGSAGPPVQCVGRHGAQLPLQGAELPLVTPPVQCVGSITPPVRDRVLVACPACPDDFGESIGESIGAPRVPAAPTFSLKPDAAAESDATCGGFALGRDAEAAERDRASLVSCRRYMFRQLEQGEPIDALLVAEQTGWPEPRVRREINSVLQEREAQHEAQKAQARHEQRSQKMKETWARRKAQAAAESNQAARLPTAEIAA